MNSSANTLREWDPATALRLAKDALILEADALCAMSERLDSGFAQVIQKIQQSQSPVHIRDLMCAKVI